MSFVEVAESSFWTRRRRTVVVLLLLMALGWIAQGSRALWEPDEGRYTAVAVQMIRTGNWLEPRLNHEVLHFSKPPLIYWLIATSIEIAGDSEFAARLPNSLAWLALVLMMLAHSKRLAPDQPLLGPVVWATSLFAFVAVNIVTTDLILTAAECLAGLGFVIWWKDSRRAGLYWMWIGFGLAFLTKGPPGLLPLLPIVVFVRMQRLGLRRLILHPGIIAFATIGFGWYITASTFRPDLVDYWLFSEVAGRIGGEFSHRNSELLGWVKPYVPVIVTGMLPWAAMATPGRWKDVWRSGEDRFLILWISLPLLVFFFSASRMPLYLLPLTVPAALLIARRLPHDLTGRPWFRVTAASWLVFLLFIKVGASVYPVDRDPRPLAAAIEQVSGPSVEEVHFVDMNGWYGLTFYLGTEVEQISLEVTVDANNGYQSVWERLTEELEEDSGHNVVYVVPEVMRSRFEAVLTGRDWIPGPKSFSIDGLVIYGSPSPATPKRKRTPY